MNRRHFIRKSVATVVAGYGLSELPHSAFPALSDQKRIGLQLYSIKDDLEKDFRGV
ncbi:MAG: hypothetical protein LUG96_11180 [Tannerellaceae bacterium]|nr:hypothetical protein [Tannerellaceae bacterium]